MLQSIFIGLLLLLTPVVEAKPTCDEVIGADLTPVIQPVSRYVTKVLERAKDGMAKAGSEPVDPDFHLEGWPLYIDQIFAGLRDERLRIVEQQRSLHEHTACLRLDVLLLECAIEQVRVAMNQQVVRKSTAGLDELLELVEFLNERMKHLLAGARDPTYEDPRWGWKHSFDAEVTSWCCPQSIPGNTCDEVPTGTCQGSEFETLNACVTYGCVPPAGRDASSDDEQMCPFDTDYLPPTIAGYGCDSAILGSRASASYPSLQKEMEGIQKLLGEIEAFRDEAKESVDLIREIETFLGRTPPSESVATARTHKRFQGCLQFLKKCEDTSAECTGDSDCSAGKKCIKVSLKGTCEDDPSRICVEDSECGAGKECQLPTDAAFVEIRGPFSIERNNLGILDAFRRLRAAQGLNRKPSDRFLFASEEGGEETGTGASLDILETGRRGFQIFSEVQGGAEASPYAIGSDAEFQVVEALKGLREGMSKLAKLAHDKDGLREFVRGFAFLLRRSCIFRPCNLILDKIMRFAFTDECFPYTTGEYRSDTCGSPRAEKCIKASNKLIDPDGDGKDPHPFGAPATSGFPWPTEDPNWRC